MPVRRGPGEPGRFSQAHEGVVYGCCVPALTRFTNPHCPGPPRFTRTSAEHSGMSILISYSQARRAQLQGEGLTGTTVQKIVLRIPGEIARNDGLF